jgi:APA family basic amino acid/polyamine antiporter
VGAATFVALGAVVSCFGALNGWLLLQGQIPLAAARDRLFPEFFGKVSKSNTPANALVFSTGLASVLMVMNYNKSLVDQFTFIILLATLNTLIPYIFCTMSEILILARDPARGSGPRLSAGLILSLLAFAYALWAIGGAGQEIVYWGFILLMAGVPVYVWIRLQRQPD